MSTQSGGRPVVDFGDVEHVIGIAAEQQSVERDRLSVEELESVARDLDIPERFVRPAIDELRRRRAEQLAAEQARSRRRRLIGLGAFGVVGVLALVAFIGSASLADTHRDVQRQRAQVVNVLERQRAVHATMAPAPGTQPTDAQLAELTGAENRVRIERARYDQLVTGYNSQASGLFGGAWRALRGLPEALPLSNEIDGAW